LQFVVDALNGKGLFSVEVEPAEEELYDRLLRKAPPILREIVGDYQASGPNLQWFSRDWPTTWTNVTRYWTARPVELAPGPSGGAGFVHTFADRLGRTPYEEALRFFLLLIINPEWDKLAGPCARCDNYYIRRTARNKVYCSRACGTSATAIAAVRKRRDEEHADKLRRAREAAQQWIKSRSRFDWKQWISRKEPDITVKFLTRAANNGNLKAPVRN
jgi:hypothetical protein